MKHFVRKIGNELCIDYEYFINAFIRPSKQGNLSGLALRLQALLLTKLSFYNYKKMPSRRKMAKTLGANEASIHKCLVTLEKNEFFYRSVDPELEGMVRADEENQKKYDAFYKDRIEKVKEKGGFSNFFILNTNYKSEIKSHEEAIKSLIDDIVNQNNGFLINSLQSEVSCSDVNYNNKLVEAATVQNFLIELLKDKNTLMHIIKKSTNHE